MAQKEIEVILTRLLAIWRHRLLAWILREPSSSTMSRQRGS